MKKEKLVYLFLAIFCAVQLHAQKQADHTTWDKILILNVTDEGKVNYQDIIKDSPMFYKYFRHLSEHPPTEKWSKEETLAYWINAYNAIAVKMIIDNYPVKSINELHEPWNQRFFRIKDKRYSLDDIEHNILRKMGEPGIHFLINCAANSSPSLWNTAYCARNIKEALSEQTKKYINDPKYNTITPDEIVVSPIFKWYKDDFNNGNIIGYLNKYSNVKINENAKINYKEYDWGLNEM